MKEPLVRAFGWSYRNLGTKLFFRFDSEPIHEFMLDTGELLGRIPGVPAIVGATLRIRRENLHTSVAGISFDVPIGLSAGFDHEAQLPRIIGALGFGFESVGTITNKPYGGNPMPQMKRLVKSQAILVNKGFKTTGIDAVLARLKGVRFPVPVGISIGRTNTEAHETHADAIADIAESFTKVKASGVPFAYYELNISCPNLLKDISFYIPEKLDALLSVLDVRTLGKPLFLKMPITIEDDAIRALLDVAIRHGVAAVTFGNLLKDRDDPAFDKNEIASVAHYKGNWAGKPTQRRSDELVRLAYIHCKGALAVVGCGGVFTAADAYRKVRLGASLVQLAAGAVFMGPQVAAEISIGLSDMLKRDGFVRLADAVGADA